MIELKGLTLAYGRKKIIENITVCIPKGEITCLLGINGVGKSTILKAIAGLMPIKKGTITINQETLSTKTLSNISYISDQFSLPGSYTIKKCLDYMNYFYPNFQVEKALKLTEFLKLNLNDKVSQLSKGNTAKVNLLLGLSLQCDFILMDEPFSGIDILSRERIIEALTSEFIDEGQGVIITTHEIEEIERIADRVLFVNDGQIIKDFYPEDMRLEGMSIVDVMKEVYE